MPPKCSANNKRNRLTVPKPKPYKLFNADCFNVFPRLRPNSIDMVMCDPPYGTTACKWDSIIPLKPMWRQLNQVVKLNGAVVFTASQPFTTTLIGSNKHHFRYCWVWQKTKATLFQHANRMPMKGHEDIVVFYKRLPIYNPQKTFVGIKDRRKTFTKRPNNPEFTKNAKGFNGCKGNFR